MPFEWLDHASQDGAVDDGIECSMNFVNFGGDLLFADDDDSNLSANLCDEYDDGDEDCDGDDEIRLQIAAAESTGRQPMCSTPDAKRRKLDVDVSERRKSMDSTGSSSSHVKRPMNAFMLWSQMERRKMAGTEPNLHNSVISTMLGQRWQKMSYAERQPFVRQAERVRELHLQEHPNYRYCPRRKEKRKPGQRRNCVRQQPTPPAAVQASHQIRPTLSFASGINSLSVVNSAEGDASEEQPIRCFRATLGQNLSSAIDKYSFLSSYPVSSATSNRLQLKLTIDSSFKEKLKRSRSLQESATSSSSGRLFKPIAECFDDAISVQSTTSVPSTDDSGWGSSSNSGSSMSDCNTSITENELTLDDVLNYLPPHDSDITLTNQPSAAEEQSFVLHSEDLCTPNPVFILPQYQLIYDDGTEAELSELDMLNLNFGLNNNNTYQFAFESE